MSKTYATITGRVGRDPDTRPTKIGDVLKFSLAQTTGYGDNDTRWVSVAVFNEGLRARSAEIHKGASVAVEGYLEEQVVKGEMVYDLIADRLGIIEWFPKTKKGERVAVAAASSTGGYSADL